MNNWSDPRLNENVGVDTSYHGSVGVPDATYDAGLRAYMLKVYNTMAAGVAFTGVVAYLVGNSSLVNMLFSATGGPSALGYIAIFAPLAFVLLLGAGISRMSTGALQVAFWAFAAIMGVSFSTIFVTFTGSSIAQTFFATAIAFLGLSIWGYTTKKDLSGWGSFLIMGVWGLIAASLLNFFVFKSGVMHLAISGIGVLVFAGLTAYDTQKIKSMYYHVQGTDMMGKTVILGALSLYLDFVNMFQFLLSFLGSND